MRNYKIIGFVKLTAYVRMIILYTLFVIWKRKKQIDSNQYQRDSVYLVRPTSDKPKAQSSALRFQHDTLLVLGIVRRLLIYCFE